MFEEPGRVEQEQREGNEQHRSQGFSTHFSSPPLSPPCRSITDLGQGVSSCTGCLPVHELKWFAVSSKPALHFMKGQT